MKTSKIYFSIFFILCITIQYKSLGQSCIGTAGQVKWSYWLDVIPSPDTSDLFVNENFPSRPTGFQTIGSLKSPVNFADNMGTLIRGFIRVPATATYRFNITGDDKSAFYLSPTQNPNSKQKRAEVKTYTSEGQHYKEANQTSAPIELIGGNYYYFEVLNVEGTGGDHCTVYWRKPNDTDTLWKIIDYNYLSEYSCGQVCPPRGTACNDGNANTVNDQQDGFCNCVGIASTSNACVGERGTIGAYYYDNIPGSYVEFDLLNAPKFPLLPDRKELLKGAYGPLESYKKIDYGTLVQAYLTVPVTGLYEFNLTGDNQTFLFMSKNDSLEYKQQHQAFVISAVDETGHNVSVMQSITPLLLEKGKFYYFEFRHKQSSWRDHFRLYWKTPFHERREWKLIPNFYIHEYKCEVSCIAQNTPCNDGNPYTKNDKINSVCECEGTPCTGLDCDDDEGRYTNLEACSPTNIILATEENSWVSCQNAANPNPSRASLTKWIKYDFTNQFKFQNSRVWNYNISNKTTQGFKTVYVDYSIDGIGWTQLGNTYTWPQASGATDYAGFIGPNFNDLKARYILISAVDNWGDPSCAGFSKITFDAIQCDPAGTTCDDDNPLTSYDTFDANCNCKGVDINCASDTLSLVSVNLSSEVFKAKKIINSVSIVPNQTNVSFVAGNTIVLLPGFKTEGQTVFSANIADCIQAQFIQNEQASIAYQEKIKAKQAQNGLVNTSETSEAVKKIVFKINEPSHLKLELRDSKQNTLAVILDQYSENIGSFTKYIPTSRLSSGTYYVYLKVGTNEISEAFEIVK